MSNNNEINSNFLQQIANLISNYSNEIINKDNGLYYKKINYYKIIKDISRIIKNEDEYLKLKNNANLIIKNYYNNKIFVNKLMKLIKN